MSKTEIYIFRHGETDWNKERRFQGHTDIPLNQNGRQQASELALKIRKINPELILTSDLLRAKQTAEIVNDLLKVSIIACCDLFLKRSTEVFGRELLFLRSAATF